MKITLYTIEKSEKDEYMDILNTLSKSISKFADFELMSLFNNQIAKAHKISPEDSKKAYTETFIPHLGGYNIALDIRSKQTDSHGFAKLLLDKLEIRFFIGGAYGFEPGFLTKCQKTLSLSPLTMSHKIAKIVLAEQIFRGLSINHNHPYHK